HHGCAMDAGGAVNENFRVGLIERGECELDRGLEDFGRLGLKVVVDAIPEDLDAIGLGEGRVIELDLHVDDVGDAGGGDFAHVRFRPDAAADRDASCDSCHVSPPNLYILLTVMCLN